jgi:hypothetical protein
MHVHRGGAAGLKQARWLASVDDTLLAGETDGFAVDFTVSGAPVQVRTAGVDVYTDAVDFFAQAGEDKYVKTTATTIGLLTFPISFGQGLLIESAGTNLAFPSEDFNSASWSKAGVTVGNNAQVAPDGNTTGDTLTATATTNDHKADIVTDPSSTAGSNYTYSMFVKQGTHRYFSLYVGNVGASSRFYQATFDFDTVAETQHVAGANGTYVSSSITEIGSGWYRASVTGSHAAGTTAYFGLQMNSSGTPTISGTSFGVETWLAAATETIHIWGAQYELGNFATSYRLTTTGADVRNADDISVAVADLGFSATVGTMYVDATTAPATGTQVFWQVDDVTANERMLIWRNTADPMTSVVDGGVDQVSIDSGSLTSSTRHQNTFAYKANDFATSWDGAAATADTSGTLPTVTTFRPGRDHSASHFNSYIRRLVYVPRRVIDADLPAWRYNF